MRKLMCAILSTLTLSLMIGCSDDDKSDGYQFEITDVFRFLYKNEVDSIVSSFGFSSFSLGHYQKQNDGNYKLIEWRYSLSSEFRKDKNGTYISCQATSASQEAGKIYYDFNYETKVITYYDILPNYDKIDLHPITLKWKNFDEEAKLPGTWYITSEIDSTLLSFGDGKFKQYVFLRNNPNPVSHVNGSYTSFGNGYFWKGEFIDQDKKVSVTIPQDTFYVKYTMYQEVNKDIMDIIYPPRLKGKYKRLQ